MYFQWCSDDDDDDNNNNNRGGTWKAGRKIERKGEEKSKE
jgi:hypothetical protein